MNDVNRKLKLYDELYDKADEIGRQNNPCNIKVQGNLVTCRWCPYWCCEGCRHNGPKGCRVKSLSCKLYLCHRAMKYVPESEKTKIRDLLTLSYKENLLHPRASRADIKRILKGEDRKVPSHIDNSAFDDMFDDL